jgi:hypothetical protein
MSAMQSSKSMKSGQRFGLWTLVRRDEADGERWICRCHCGTKRPVGSFNLLYGKSRSCGCGPRSYYKGKHGHCRHPLYGTWKQMNYRCHNKSHSCYKRYGARGIVVCDRWRKSFTAFADDMGPKPGPGYTVDRIDNNGPYSPDNCRWASHRQQGRNMSRNRLVTFRGRTLTVAEWAEVLGISPSSMRYRLEKAGWTIERALSTPVDEQNPNRRRVRGRRPPCGAFGP